MMSNSPILLPVGALWMEVQWIHPFCPSMSLIVDFLSLVTGEITGVIDIALISLIVHLILPIPLVPRDKQQLLKQMRRTATQRKKKWLSVHSATFVLTLVIPWSFTKIIFMFPATNYSRIAPKLFLLCTVSCRKSRPPFECSFEKISVMANMLP